MKKYAAHSVLLFLLVLHMGCREILRGIERNTRNFQVNTTADTPDTNPGDNRCRDSNGKCSLRAAIQEANTSQGLQYIIDVPEDRYLLDSTLNIYANIVTIRGEGAKKTIIRGKGRDALNGFTIFHIDSARNEKLQSVSLENLAIIRGFAPSLDDEFDDNPHRISHGAGGGILIRKNTNVRLTNVTFRKNVARIGGGGIANSGRLTMIGCNVQNNNNELRYGGGIINFSSGVLSMNRCAIVRNTTGETEPDARYPYGAGIMNSGSLSIINSTISENIADNRGRGAGIYINGTKSVRIKNTTIANNQVRFADNGSGIYLQEGTDITILNSIVAENTLTISRQVSNIRGPGRVQDAGGNIFVNDAHLEPLQASNNTWIHLLESTSPAIDAGSRLTPGSDPAACPDTDQLAHARNGICDSGAVEYQSDGL